MNPIILRLLRTELLIYMSDTLNYIYQTNSLLEKTSKQDQLLLAHYSELERKENLCYFWGKLTQPFITARCLITLSNIVQSSFNLSPFQLALLKDPIVTAGNDKIRFEGFSHCAGVYARVDVMPDGHDGEFIDNGTTNVDFNQQMIATLGAVKKSEQVVLSVGQKEVGLHKGGESVIERKVPLPTKWIKGLSTVQLFMADSEEVVRMNKIQAVQLFRSIPKGTVKADYYLGIRGKKPYLSPVKSPNAVCIGGIHRLRLVELLVPMVDEIRVYAHDKGQSTIWQLYMGAVRFTIALSRECFRGFSGEGAALEALIEDIPDELLQRFDNFSFANQEFNPTMMAIENNVDFQKIENLSARLSAMGMLGYDLEMNNFFYRRLPFKLERILGLNPRLKGAEKLLAEKKVKIVSKTPEKVEARVEGSGVTHTVVLEADRSRCTCAWYARHQGERGVCKHVLATQMLVKG